MNAINPLEFKTFQARQQKQPQHLPPLDLLDIVMSRRFGAEYQPIVEVQTGEIRGYQASARFWTKSQQPIAAGAMFALLHRNPLLLFYTELEMKRLQIEQSPGEGWLLLDLDIDSFFEGSKQACNPFLHLFKHHAWSDVELIVNVVENHNLADAHRSQHIVELLHENGTSIALEDIGMRWGMFSLSAFTDATVIKLNRLTFDEMGSRNAQAMLDWLVGAARKIGIQIIMNGIETCEQFEWAKRMGVDCVQGGLFARQDVTVR